VGQLLFAPWAWAYSALHPWMVGKWVPVITGKERQVCATLHGARHVPERLCDSCLVTWGRYSKCSTFTFLPLEGWESWWA